jgi:hypothetical protein
VRARLNNALGEGDFGQRWEFAPPSSCAPSTSIWEVAPSLVSSSDDGVKRASRPWWAAGGSRGVGERNKQKNEPFFPTNQWQWRVIFTNSTKSSFVEHLLRHSTKSMDLGSCSTFFSEQICGGAAGAGHVWLEKLGAELVFRIWSCLELCQTRP